MAPSFRDSYCNPDFDPSRFLSPDLALSCAGNEVSPYICCPNDPCAFGPAGDNHGHGTFIAGILGAVANNDIGIAGIDQECKILSVRISGIGSAGVISTTGRVIVALETIHSNSAYDSVRVINMSFKSYIEDEVTLEAFHNAVIALYSENRFLVAASTNDGLGAADFYYPAAFEEVICVGGIDSLGSRFQLPCNSAASGTGDALDFMAPGMAHVSTVCQSNPCPTCPYSTYPCHSDPGTTLFLRFNFQMGTSFAAPMVCGAISLILARAIELDIVDIDTWSGLTFDDMYLILQLSARDQVSGLPPPFGPGDPLDTAGEDDYYGHGLIDIDAALDVLEALYCTGC